MTRSEIDEVNKLAKGSDIQSAAREFLRLAKDDHANSAAAVNGIVDEVTQWNDADEETRAGIDAYKASGDTATEGEKDSATNGKKSGGKSQAKSK